MIKKTFIAALCLVVVYINCNAQTDTSIRRIGDPVAPPLFDQYIGIQANQLIQQIINLNNSAATLNNPYLLTYSLNLAKSGWGIQAAVGYTYQDITDKNQPVNRESKINDLSYRIGIGKKVMIGKRLQAGFGFDFEGAYMLDKTYNISVTNFGTGIDSTVTTTNSKTTSIGIGPEVSLEVYITKRLLIGTEASYYFTWSKQKQNVQDLDTSPDPNTGITSTVLTTSNTETDTSDFSINLPVAIFLIVKF
jgi:hypothetical protein